MASIAPGSPARRRIKTGIIVLAVLLALVAAVASQQGGGQAPPKPGISAGHAKRIAAFNGIALDDSEEARIGEYLAYNGNFSSLEYEAVRSGRGARFTLTVGNRMESQQAATVFGSDPVNVVIDLLLCNRRKNACAFRVSGVATGYMSPAGSGTDYPSEFRLENNRTLVLESIDFDYCDGRRFCNVNFEAYDVVEVRIG